MDILFGADTPLAVRFFIAFVIVLGLIGATAYVVRRFGGERLGAAATRGRQPRLAVIDAAAVDGRRRLILIRRDNIEHLLMIGGPTDVVVELNIVRAATATREQAPARAPAATETLPRAVPLGEGTMWPLQPQVEPAAPPSPPPPAPRPQRPQVAEEPAAWQPEPETPSPAPPPRQARKVDPLAGLAAELLRSPPPPPTSEPATVARRPAAPRPPARAPAREPAREPTAEATQATQPQFASPTDQNLAEMAQRLEAALRRPAKKPEEMRLTDYSPNPPAAAEPPTSAVEPRPPRSERRPLRAEPTLENPRAEKPPPVEEPAPEPPAVEEPRPEPARTEQPRSEQPKGPPQRSLYDSLEQEMASLLGRPGKT